MLLLPQSKLLKNMEHQNNQKTIKRIPGIGLLIDEKGDPNRTVVNRTDTFNFIPVELFIVRLLSSSILVLNHIPCDV